MFQATDLLRPVNMAQGDIGRRRKGAGGKGFQAADINLAHRLAGAGTDGGQVAGGDNRQLAAQLIALGTGQGIQLLIVLLDGALQVLLFALCTLAGLAEQHIAWANKRNGAKNRPRLAGAVMQHQHLFLQLSADAGNHSGIELRQQGLALAEHGHRIVVAAQHQQLGAALAQLNNKVVVQLAGITGRRAGVEDIPSHQHGIHLLRLHLLDQPGEKRLVLGLAGLAHKVLAKVPVGAVQNAHGAVPDSTLKTRAHVTPWLCRAGFILCQGRPILG